MITNGHVDKFLKDAEEQTQVHLRVQVFPQKDSICFLCPYLAFPHYYSNLEMNYNSCYLKSTDRAAKDLTVTGESTFFTESRKHECLPWA